MAGSITKSVVASNGDAPTTFHKRTHSLGSGGDPNKAIKVIDAQYVVGLEAQIHELHNFIPQKSLVACESFFHGQRWIYYSSMFANEGRRTQPSLRKRLDAKTQSKKWV